MPHRANGVLTAEKHTVKICPMHGMPIHQTRMFWIMRHSTFLEPGNASVVHQYVQSPAFFQDLRGDSLPVVFLPYIKG